MKTKKIRLVKLLGRCWLGNKTGDTLIPRGTTIQLLRRTANGGYGRLLDGDFSHIKGKRNRTFYMSYWGAIEQEKQ